MLTPPTHNLNKIEGKELTYLGVMFAQMPWLDLYTTNNHFAAGIHAGKGHVNPPPQKSINWYHGIIYYRIKPFHQSDLIKPVVLQNLMRLQRFVAEAGIELYRRGILT